MPTEITVPRLGWNMDEGVFAGWLKRDGDAVRAGDALFKLESEKAVEEVETLDAGTLHLPPDGPKEGDKIPVGKVIGYLLAPGESPPTARRPAAPAAGPAARRLARELAVDLAAVAGSGRAGRITEADVRRTAVSPRAKRAARELGIDPTGLAGSGRNGRVRERDVRAAAVSTPAAEGDAVPVGPVRRAIADRMVQSLRTAAPVTLTTTADATNLVGLRNQFKAAAAAGEPVPSLTDFLIKLTAAALQKHPALNARWEGDRIVTLRHVHVGVAVDSDAGLVVPVVRDVPALPLGQLARRTRDLIERARSRKLTADEMRGGTFTVSNLGSFGVDAFTPIINPPECAVLGVGRVRSRPAVVGRRVVARDEITLSLTFDHRVVDGAPAARFLQTLTGAIEQPGPWLVK